MSQQKSEGLSIPDSVVEQTVIVTIDGPAGAGKSTLARALAQRLQFQFLDTGAMYRAVALQVQRSQVDPTDERALARCLAEVQLDLQFSKVFLNGEDVTEVIRTPEVTNFVGQVADKAVVRNFLTDLQRELATGRDVVTEGRDQGTVVFPDARCKFFLTASPETRARRRVEDFAARGIAADYERVLADQIDRDRRDQERKLSPLRAAADAYHVDTSEMTIEEVLQILQEKVEQARHRNEQSSLI